MLQSSKLLLSLRALFRFFFLLQTFTALRALLCLFLSIAQIDPRYVCTSCLPCKLSRAFVQTQMTQLFNALCIDEHSSPKTGKTIGVKGFKNNFEQEI